MALSFLAFLSLAAPPQVAGEAPILAVLSARRSVHAASFGGDEVESDKVLDDRDERASGATSAR